jgi:general secretion pathway protein B
MSLILEALRKSEEQRRLGQAPDLVSADAWSTRRRYRSEPSRARALLWIVPLVAAATAGAWYYLHTRVPRDSAAETSTSATARTATGVPVEAPASRAPTGNSSVQPRAALPGMPAAPAPAPGPAIAGARDAIRSPASAPVGAPHINSASPDNAAAGERQSAEMRDKFERGEVFANSPDLLAVKPPTGDTPYVPPEAALPEPIPDAQNEPMPIASVPVPADTGHAASTPAPVLADTTPAPTVAAPIPPAQTTEVPATLNLPPPAAAPALPIGQNPAVPGYEPAVPAVYELPFATRNGLPPLRVIMHVWSAEPDKRFVVIDDVRAAEGQPLANGLDVVEIRTDGVVLSYNGQRFLLPRNGR